MRKRWEYQIIERSLGSRPSSFTSVLNRMGAQGWRIVDQSYRMNNGQGSVMMERERFD